MRLVTNLRTLVSRWEPVAWDGVTARFARTYAEVTQDLKPEDVLLINCDPGLTLKLCVYLWLTRRRTPLIAVDLVFGRRPSSAAELMLAAVKRVLLRRVSLFINYFRENPGYVTYYGITPERSAFVHFKPNLRFNIDARPGPDGEYVLCFGRSRRDYDTFFQAVAQLPYPAAIPRPNFAELQKHGSQFTYRLEDLPPNVRLLEDDGSTESMVRILSAAALVVLPLRSDTLTAGIGVYLNAMLLEKCVIITAGPTVTDVLTDEAIFVQPQDPDGLAAAIRTAWTDEQLRRTTAAKGYRHAVQLGGEHELHQRIVDQAMQWLRRRHIAAESKELASRR